MWRSTSALVALMLLSSAKAQQRSACDPLVPENCMLPFPSDFHYYEDASTPTGFRYNFPDEASPVDRNGDHFSLSKYSRLDGASPSTTMMTYFPDLQLDNVPGWQDLARSLDADCPTVLLDYETGEFLPHFGELDYTTDRTNTRAFMIWPIEMLKYGHKYVVAMRNLRNSTGLVEPTDAFRSLRDAIPTSDPDIEFRRSAYEDMFSRLEQVGIQRRELQMAWYFVTGSEEFNTGYLRRVQQDAKNYVPAGGPGYEIVSVEDNYNDRIYRRIEGKMEVPHYLTDDARPGSELVLDAEGWPVYQGMKEVPFSVFIPYSCLDRKCPIVNYGHGLLGSRAEPSYSAQSTVANDYGYIMVSVDMWGMCQFDVPSIVLMLLTDLGQANIIPDRSIQGLLNHFLVVQLARNDFANDPNVIFNGTSVIDTSRVYYWGISQGGILGSVIVALSEDIERGHLGVPGGPYPLLLARSVDFDPFFSVLKGRYANAIDRILILSMLGLLWDRAEPGGYMSLLKDKGVYIDYAKGDAQVTYLGAYFMARSAGAKIFENNVDCKESTPIYGFDVVSGSHFGSVMTGFDYNVGCGPVENIPPSKDTDTHGTPRSDIRNKEQAHLFLTTGEVRDECGGAGCYSN